MHTNLFYLKNIPKFCGDSKYFKKIDNGNAFDLLRCPSPPNKIYMYDTMAIFRE